MGRGFEGAGAGYAVRCNVVSTVVCRSLLSRAGKIPDCLREW